MGFLDNFIQLIPGRKKPPNLTTPAPQQIVIASTFPAWEVNTPQYQAPTPYTMINEGYRLNEIVYSCINMRCKAIGEAPCRVIDEAGETPETIKDHPLKLLLKSVNERITEQQFWQISELYLLVAGFCAWEKERNNLGEVIRLWPMRPDWCGFFRGDNRLLDRIRYQPYGLPPVDVSVDDVLIFQYFDPLYPMLKGWSPTMQAYKLMGVDNNTTNFLDLFFKSGAVPAGLLKTLAVLSDPEAERIRNRWQTQHGGSTNWSRPAVLGSGVEYQSMTMPFKDMGFGDIDARSEARLCGLYQVPPIMISAKIGMDRSTYSNYGEAKKSFYENTVMNEWVYLAGQVQQQMLPDFGEEDNLVVEFDTTGIKALQEDRTAQWTRAVTAATSGVITRDEARTEMGLDPIDDVPVFVGSGAPAVGEETQEAEEIPPALLAAGQQAEQDGMDEMDKEEMPDGKEAKPDPEADQEEKRFREFAARRKKEGKRADILKFNFKHLQGLRLSLLLNEVGVTSGSPF
jgi:HK97 family phage portal protein